MSRGYITKGVNLFVCTHLCVCMCFDYCCIFKGVNIGYRFESEVVRGDDLCEDVEKLDCT